jgi:hypothetical protein
LDAQRLALRHAVDWRILPSESSTRVEPSASAPVKVALRHTAHESDALRYLHAVVAAWQESPGTAWSVSEGTLNVPIDADTQWLIWLDAPVPGPVLSWVAGWSRAGEQRGTGHATAIWRNAQVSDCKRAAAWRRTSFTFCRVCRRRILPRCWTRIFPNA